MRVPQRGVTMIQGEVILFKNWFYFTFKGMDSHKSSSLPIFTG